MNSFDLENRVHFEHWFDLRDQLFHDTSDARIWRGVANAEWCMHSSLDRFLSENFIADRARATNHLRDLYQRFLVEVDGEAPEDQQDLWALGQHWGLPTPYLDWTYSAMVALFFAISSTDPYSPPTERVGCVWRLEKDAPAFRAGGDLSLVELSAGPWNRRLRGQQGLFLQNDAGGCAVTRMSERGYLAHLTAYTFPYTIATEAMRDLRSMTIDDLRLFPDMAGVIRHVRSMAVREGQRIA